MPGNADGLQIFGPDSSTPLGQINCHLRHLDHDRTRSNTRPRNQKFSTPAHRAWSASVHACRIAVPHPAPAVTAAGRQNLVVVDKTATGIVRTELEAVLFVPLKSGIA